jgi:predicted enzyme related to lactoylglutathione lyase
MLHSPHHSKKLPIYFLLPTGYLPKNFTQNLLDFFLFHHFVTHKNVIKLLALYCIQKHTIMDKSTNALNWFEIPATDINRAKSFYENVFDIEMGGTEMMGMKMAFFPGEPNNGKASGSIVEGPMHKPSQEGSVVYLNANPDMDGVIEKIEGAGGQVVMPKTPIGGDMGYMAFFLDTEGNKIGLHSTN